MPTECEGISWPRRIPLGVEKDAMVRELRLHENGLSEADLDTVFPTPSLEGIDHAPLRDIIDNMERCYCASIGYEFMYIDYTPQKDWLQQRVESVASAPILNADTRRWILGTRHCRREHGTASGFTLCRS